MPVLPPSYISTLQQVKYNNNVFLFENFTQTQVNEIKEKHMIQGTIGVRVMDVGELYWKTSIKSPALIFGQSGLAFGDIFSLITTSWNNIISANVPGYIPALPLMESASISINEKGVDVSANFVSDFSGPFYLSDTRDSSNPPFTARTAKWYDCTVYAQQMPSAFSGNLPNTVTGAVIEAKIDLKADIGKKFFIGQGQTPFFSINKYTISGEMTLLASAYDLALGTNQISTQYANGQPLTITGPINIVLQIGLLPLNIGVLSMKQEYQTVASAGDVNKITFKFTSFTL